MNTPTHVLINWTAASCFARGKAPLSAVLLGSLAPDVPLYLLSAGGALWFGVVQNGEPAEVARHMYSNLFYNDPLWITLHNALHSPLVSLTALAILFGRFREQFWDQWWSWFFLSCLLHALVDIPVHHDDGPLIFWPLNWTYRFASPISYWDPHHHGRVTMMLEAGLVVLLVGIGAARKFRGRASMTED